MEVYQKSMTYSCAFNSEQRRPLGGWLKRKKIHDGEIVLETPTFIIRFWGRQLGEAQADLWLQLMYEASKAPLGEPVIINRAALLRAIGRSTGKTMYEWLHRAVHDLSFGMISISAKGKYEISMHPKSRP